MEYKTLFTSTQKVFYDHMHIRLYYDNIDNRHICKIVSKPEKSLDAVIFYTHTITG